MSKPAGTQPFAALSTPYSPSIDGLRAVAVLLVLGFHIFPAWIKGGFIGVDIFFVISGYLISGILFKDLKQGHFSLRHFYARRIRRIFPALSAVLLACLVTGWFLLTPADYQALGKHVAGGAGFIANLLLWQEAGYFDSAAETKPLLHLWSLGIEEQFYIFWPLLLYVTRKGRKRIPLALSLVAVLSFALNMAIVHSDAVAAFYGPLSRVWELALGGLLAWVVRLQGWALTKRVQHGLQLAGLGAIVVGACLLTKTASFPGAWALLPTLGAAALIAAGDGVGFNKYVLAQRPVVAIGLISFPLYLWHWPLFVFTKLADVEMTLAVRWSLIAGSFVLATLTYLFIEKPIRFGSFGRRHRRLSIQLLLASVMGLGLAGLGLFAEGGAPGRFPADLQSVLTYRYDSAAAYHEGSCFLTENKESVFGDCHFGVKNPAAPSLFLWGDSHAAHLIPGLLALRGGDTRLSLYAAGGCPPILGYEIKDRPNCMAINDDIFARIQAEKPDQVVLAAVWGNHDWKKIADTLTKLHAAGVARIVVVGQVPIWIGSLPKGIFHYVRRHPHAPLPVRLRKEVSDGRGLDADMQAFMTSLGVSYVSPWQILCNDEGCETGIDQGEILAWDYGHMTLTGSKIIVQHLPR